MKAKPNPKDAEIELRPDGWERFREAVHAAAKSGPKRREAPTSKPKARPTNP
jgi:hypothetical protein